MLRTGSALPKTVKVGGKKREERKKRKEAIQATEASDPDSE